MKLGPFLIFTGALVATACGYHPLYSGADSVSFGVVAAASKSPHLGALESALAGARAELSRGGALRGGSDYPRVVVELVRVDEVASGIAATGAAGSAPLARGSAVGVTVRGWVEEREGGGPSRDSGDVRRVEEVTQGAGTLGSSVAFDDAARAAARAAGESVARRVLGIVEPSVAPM